MKISKKSLQRIIKEELDSLILKEHNHTPRDRGEIGGRRSQDAASQGRPSTFPNAGSESPQRDQGLIRSFMGWRSSPGDVVAHAYVWLQREGEKPDWWVGNENYMTLSGYSERYSAGYESTPWFSQIIDLIDEHDPRAIARYLDKVNATGFGKLEGGINWSNDYNAAASGKIRLAVPSTQMGANQERVYENMLQNNLYKASKEYKNDYDYYPFPDITPSRDANSNSYAFSVIRRALGYGPRVNNDMFPGYNIQIIK